MNLIYMFEESLTRKQLIAIGGIRLRGVIGVIEYIDGSFLFATICYITLIALVLS
jgi:hypothetical protein